jgi:predicted Zn-dependent peptidase
MTRIHQHQLSNGLRIVAEPVPGAQSLAMTLLTPAGVAREPADKLGVAAMLSEMLFRGAGDLDARAHSDALDQLGVQRDTSVETRHLRLGATMIGEKLPDALPLLADMARRPMFAESALEPSRDLCLQDLEAVEDEPQQKVSIALRRRHYPQPIGRSTLGQHEHLEAMTLGDVRMFWRNACVPGGGILSFAGKFDWPQLLGLIEASFGDWAGGVEDVVPQPDATAPRGYAHEPAESVQVHIALAYDAPPEVDDNSILQRAATSVLSGGMSGRLFTEVREKRGLCYAVYAAYAGQKDRGAMIAYSGTTAPRAQETLDVLAGELRRLSDGVQRDEFDRAIVGMKSRLVMQGESTGARSAAIAFDQAVYGRPRTLDERAAQVDAVTLEALNEYLAAHRPGAMTVVTVGPEELKAPM